MAIASLVLKKNATNRKHMTTKKEFETWLFRQKPDKVFIYIEGSKQALTGCVMSNFYRDTKQPQDVGSSFSLNEPVWLKRFIGEVCYAFASKLTAAQVQVLYLKMFK